MKRKQLSEQEIVAIWKVENNQESEYSDEKLMLNSIINCPSFQNFAQLIRSVHYGEEYL